MYQGLIRLFLWFFVFVGGVHPTFQSLDTFLKATSNTHFFISTLTWNSDASCDKEELLYRSGLALQRMASREQLIQALGQISSRPRYKEVLLKVAPHSDARTIDLVFDIKNHWILEKVVIRGIKWGKPAFLDLYQIQQGEVFDDQKHQESVKRITQQLANEGYCDALVVEELERKPLSRTVKVTLKINRGKQTVIRHPTVAMSFSRDHDEKCKNKIEALAQAMLEGQFFSKKKLKAFVKKAYSDARERGYSSARITVDSFKKLGDKEITLTVRVVLGERYSLSFNGNKVLTNTWLNTQFLGSMYPEWLVVPELIAEQIRLEYRKRGYFDASVAYQILAVPGAFHFDIVEGECYRIKSVAFYTKDQSAIIVPEYVLKKHPLNRPCNENSIKALLFDVVSYFKSQGYWDCVYVSRKLEGPKKNYDLSLAVTLNLGKQHCINGLNIEGYQDLLALPFFEKYKKAIVVKAPFHDQWIAEQKKFLLDYFHQRGFWYVVVEPQLVTQEAAAGKVHVLLNWKVALGELVTLGKTYIEGSTRLSHSKIQRFMHSKEGEVWTPATVASVRKRLKDTGLFKSVSVQTPSGVGPQKPLMVNVIDDDPYELLLRIGYFITPNTLLPENLSTYKAGVSFNVKNPFNYGDKFSLKADVSRFSREGKIRYSIPQWTDIPLSLDLEAAAEQHKEYTNVFGGDNHYTDHKKIVSALWDYERRKDFHIVLHHGFENLYFAPSVSVSDFSNEFFINESLLNKSINALFFEQRLVVNATDDHFNPTKGDALSLSMRFFAPVSSGVSASLKFLYEHAFYFPLKHHVVFALRLRGGYLVGKSLKKSLPSERFFLGGHTSVRGYDKDSVPPISKVTRDGKDLYTAHGGIGMFNANAELRVPLYGPLGGVLFQDIGFLTKKTISGLFHNAWPTSGCGLRYQSPLGAIRFDVGWKWRKAFPQETRYTWYLTIGHAF